MRRTVRTTEGPPTLRRQTCSARGSSHSCRSSVSLSVCLGADFDWQEAEKALPAAFIGSPADVAGLAVFLASDEARYIVGQTLIIDGGQLAVMPCLGDSLGPSQVRFGSWYVERQ